MVMHKLVLASIFFGTPYILLLVLYLIARYSAVDMRRIVPWIRVLRWLTCFTTGVLLTMGLVLPHFPQSYGFLSLAFSSGVISIDSWAIKRFAPRHRGIWPRFGVE
jgi:hypothetical protein